MVVRVRLRRPLSATAVKTPEPLLNVGHDRKHDMVDWRLLTRMDRKAELYDRETYLREGLAQAQEVWQERFADILAQSALLMLKPDGLRAGKLSAVYEFVTARGFTPMAAEPFQFDRLIWRELWRYQLTCATLDRLAVNDAVLLAGPALLLLLRHDGPREVPATVLLSSLKGSATLSQQKPGTLRHRLGQRNRVLSYLHVADEPADLLRELGLFFSGSHRRRLLACLAADSPDPVDLAPLTAALEKESARGDERDQLPTLEQALEATQKALLAAAASPGAPEAVRRMKKMLADAQSGTPLPWRSFTALLEQVNVRLDPWVAAVLGSSLITYDEPGTSKMLTNPDPLTWQEGK